MPPYIKTEKEAILLQNILKYFHVKELALLETESISYS
jgi:hypothetical protein